MSLVGVSWGLGRGGDAEAVGASGISRTSGYGAGSRLCLGPARLPRRARDPGSPLSPFLPPHVTCSHPVAPWKDLTRGRWSVMWRCWEAGARGGRPALRLPLFWLFPWGCLTVDRGVGCGPPPRLVPSEDRNLLSDSLGGIRVTVHWSCCRCYSLPLMLF